MPKEYVHRASLAEVFLTSCEKTSECTFTLTGQWPRAHTFFSSPDGRSHDHLQAVETVRQIGLYLAHAEFGVPLGNQFVMRDISATTYPEHMGIGHTPSDLMIEARWTSQRRDLVSGVHVTIRRGEHLVARGEGHFTCVSPAAYRRLRNAAAGSAIDYRPTGQDPADFGRTLPSDLVLAASDRPGLWLLNPDPAHPVMFDHAGDHVPGMVLLEAARQGACALLGPGLTVIPTATVNLFERYVEFTSPCWIEATELPARQPGVLHALVTGHQNGHQTFSTQLSGPIVTSRGTPFAGREIASADLPSPPTGAAAN
ncbi:ScbA/BarX family gamma-butyrolactone biosynthesis protein [Streptomyces sp. NPDC050439]|uniref:ScbA/BarX family gamma-butyrolactone biosynthesis protein n=1 Tax=unclassified Streptomyces TaxID=2593676 RepID=UPI003414034B